MREIINIQLGQCGNSIGTKFWDVITNEHGINQLGVYEGESDLQLQRVNVFFKHGNSGKHVPRSINVDLDASSLEYCKNQPIGRIFQPNSFISGHASASNNFAKGFYTDGRELLDQIMELIRTEAENCDVLQGFQLFHSLGGGTGAGLGSLLLTKIREEWPDRIISTLSIVPSPKVSETVVEPYNCVLAASYLCNLSDQTFCMDNEALHRICRQNLCLANPTYEDLNHLICNTVSGITTCLRFPGQLNTDLRKLAVNMVPFPRLHFLIPGFAPLTSREGSKYRDDYNVPQLITEMFKEKNLMTDCNMTNAKYFTVASVFRGRVSTKEVEESMMRCQNRRQSQYVEWIPSNVQTAVCDIPPRGFRISATFVANNTAIQSMFDRVLQQFLVMYRRQAFVHWYVGEGMEKEEFLESSENILDLTKEYRMYQESHMYQYDADEGTEEEHDYSKIEFNRIDEALQATKYDNQVITTPSTDKESDDNIATEIVSSQEILNSDNVVVPQEQVDNNQNMERDISTEMSILKGRNFVNY